jgi:hypothetical protein
MSKMTDEELGMLGEAYARFADAMLALCKMHAAWD